MDAPSDELVEQFVSITSSDDETAKFFLAETGWDIEDALSNYYRKMEMVSPSIIPANPQGSSLPSSSSSKFVTLSSLSKNESSSDEEQGQAFYAGGSERSGQQVLGPAKKKNEGDIVSEMFKAAKERGAELVDSSSEGGPSRARLVPFKGTGYRLGMTETDSEVVPGSSSGVTRAEQAPRETVLKMWKKGFSIDDGPLREYSDPANAGFLESIRKGEIPKELQHDVRGVELSLDMEDHHHEDYVPPKTQLRAFCGKGHMLGSPAPNVVMPATNVNPESSRSSEKNALKTMSVDESQPCTNVQIRLADGSKVTVRLNHTNTVGDLRRYIIMAHPEYEAAVFTLMTAFPSVELVDDGVSLKDANLLNAVVIQRLLSS